MTSLHLTRTATSELLSLPTYRNSKAWNRIPIHKVLTKEVHLWHSRNMNLYFFFFWCLTKVIYCPFGHTRAQIYSFQYCRLSLRMKKSYWITCHHFAIRNKQTKGYDLSITPNYPNLRKAYIFFENCVTSTINFCISNFYYFSNRACFSEIHHINLYSNGRISSTVMNTLQHSTGLIYML